MAEGMGQATQEWSPPNAYSHVNSIEEVKPLPAAVVDVEAAIDRLSNYLDRADRQLEGIAEQR